MIQLQLGKQGLTDEFLQNVKKVSANVENIRINLLKSSTRDKKELEEIKEKIVEELGYNFTAKVIGFTIIIKKWRKARKKVTN